MNSFLLRLAAIQFALTATAPALPVDLSAPPGGLGPTSDQGAAMHWVEMDEVDFGGGLKLPVRLSFLSSRDENGRDFGADQWRSPLNDARLLEKKAGRWPVLLPCGKVMSLFASMGEKAGWATSDGEWVATSKGASTLVSRADGWEMEFNKRGQLIRLRSDTGRNILWIRNASGALQSLAESIQGRPVAPACTVRRDTVTGRITSMEMHTAAGDKQWSFSYDNSQRLKAIAFPDTTSVNCVYAVLADGSQEISITGRDAITTKLAWHPVTRSLVSDGLWSYEILPQPDNNPVMRRTGPNGEVEVHHDDALKQRTLFTSADGTQTIKQKVTTGPAKAKLQSITRILGEGQDTKTANREQLLYSATYDANGLLATETNALGHQSTHAYTLHGPSPHTGVKTHSVINPLGAKTTLEFDRHGNLISETNASGHTFRYEHDLQNRHVKTTGPDGLVMETLTYNKQGKVATRTDALDAMTVYGYDEEGRLVSIVDALGNTTRHEYDARANRTATIDPLGYTTRYDYDLGNRLVATYFSEAAEGTQAAREQAASSTTRQAYDSQGRRTHTIAPDGAVTSLTTYDAFGRITSETNALGHVTKYEYDLKKGAWGCKSCSDSSFPTRIIHASGRITERTYNTDHHLLTETLAAGTPEAATTKHTYDLAGRLLSTTDPLGRTTTFEHDAVGNRTSVTFPDKTKRSYAYNSLGKLIAETNELGQTVKRDYDAYGNLIAVTDSEGHTSRTFFGNSNDSTPQADASSVLQTKSASPTGHAAVHRRTMTLSAAGVRTRFDHDALGRTTAITIAPDTPDAATTRHEYDAVGNEIATITNIGTSQDAEARSREQRTTHTYDARKRRLTTTDALNRTWTYLYNENASPGGPIPCCGAGPASPSRSTAIILPDGSRSEKIYNELGLLIETRDANITSDNDKRKAEKRELRTGTQYSYDPDGRLVELINANGQTTRWRYDARGRLAAKSHPDNASELYEHDAAGQLVSRVRPDGTSARYTYDLRGRMLTIEWSDGKTENSTFAYDAAGNLTLAENKSSKILRRYSAAGRVEKETQQIHPFASDDQAAPLPDQHLTAEVSYEYDFDGRLSRLTYPDKSTVSYHYSPRGELTEVSDSSLSAGSIRLGSATYSRRPDGKVTKLSFPNGTVTHKSYDQVGRLAEIRHLDSAGEVLFSEASRYDLSNHRTARSHADGSSDLFAYDPAGQIIAAAYDQAHATPQRASQAPGLKSAALDFEPSQTFGYDPVGNRQKATDSGMTTNYQINIADQYTQIESVAASPPTAVIEPVFDKLGNLIHDGNNTYVWDADIHLLSVTTKLKEQAVSRNGAQRTSFAYDPLHRRVARHEFSSNTTTFFVHDGWNVIEEHEASPAANHLRLTAHRAWGEDISKSLQGAGGIGGLLLTSTTANSATKTANWFHYDSNGNVIHLTDAQGNMSAHYKYDAFGKTILAQGTAADHNGYRFSTKNHETASGLAHFGYRYYSSEFGRWVSRDPAAGLAATTAKMASTSNRNKIYKASLNIIRKGDANYQMVDNSPVDLVDVNGLDIFDDIGDIFNSGFDTDRFCDDWGSAVAGFFGITCPERRDCGAEYLACAGRGVVVIAVFKGCLEPEKTALNKIYPGFGTTVVDGASGLGALGYKWACDTQKAECEQWNSANGF